MRFVLMVLVFLNLSFGVKLSDIKSNMEASLESAMVVLHDTSKQKSDKFKDLFEIFDGYFDYKLMAKLSLSTHYNNLNDSEKAKFNKAFEEKLKTDFIDKMYLYTDQKMEVVKGELVNEKRYVLESKILSKDKTYPISFKFHRASGDDFLIYDVDVMGVSIVQSYRGQFGDLKDKITIDELIAKLTKTK